MRPLIISALAALQIALDKKEYREREIIGILENDPVMRRPEDPQRWTAVVKTYSDEWTIFEIRAARENDEELEWNEHKVPTSDIDQCDMIVTDITNALTHAEALLDCMGHATNIL